MSAPHHSATGGTAALLADVLTGATRLVRGEIALARAEAAEKMRSAALALVLCVVAVVLGITATNVLAAAAVAGLVGLHLSPAIAGLIVGALVLMLAFALVRWAMYKLSPAGLTPSRSLKNLGRDAAVLKSMVNPDDPS